MNKLLENISEMRKEDAIWLVQAIVKKYDLDGCDVFEEKMEKIVYQHPNFPDLQWAGRGRRPSWVKEYLGQDESHSLQDLTSN